MFRYYNDFINMAPYKRTMSCYSVTFLAGKERPEVEDGGKIILPPSTLDELSRRNIQYPMLFKLTNAKGQKSTHCGVLEFVAEEGKAFLPYWMLSNLLLTEGDHATIENVSLPTATFVKLQPQSVEFLDISNPKAVLEKALRLFACLTEGDTIAINYNSKRYELSVLELKPAKAVSIIECDMNVDFAAPVGYKEPEPVRPPQSNDEVDSVDLSAVMSQRTNTFRAFGSEGMRLDGKKKTSPEPPTDNIVTPYERGIPNYDYKKGKITFIRNSRPKSDDSKEEKAFTVFQGQGQNLKAPKNR